MDRTCRILAELKAMVEKSEVKPGLTEKIVALIEGVNNHSVNLMDYRRFDSIEKYGYDIVDAVIEADKLQKEKTCA